MVNSESANIDRIPCEACSATSSYEIWGHRVCLDCASHWRARSPTYGDIAAKYGPNADNVAVYQAFTKNWIEKRKANAA